MKRIVKFAGHITFWRFINMKVSGNVVFNVEAPLAVVTPEAEVVGVAATGNVATGGQGPYQVTVKDPAQVPPGMAIANDGTVSGTPTTPGTYTVPVDVVDAQG
jgi:large repetitive protein